MANIQELNDVLKNSSLSEEEKNAWQNAAQYLSNEELSELIALIKDESAKMAVLKNKYLDKLEELIKQSQDNKKTTQ